MGTWGEVCLHHQVAHRLKAIIGFQGGKADSTGKTLRTGIVLILGMFLELSGSFSASLSKLRILSTTIDLSDQSSGTSCSDDNPSCSDIDADFSDNESFDDLCESQRLS